MSRGENSANDAGKERSRHVNPEERLLNASEGWRSEAEAVIRDVHSCVTQITISEVLPCTETRIYLNLETKEGQKSTIEMSQAGFRVCGDNVDLVNLTHEVYYETPYALLNDISTAYRLSFANALAHKLENLTSI